MTTLQLLQATIEERDIARADLEKVVGYNTKLQKKYEAATRHYNQIIDKLRSELHDFRLENSGQAARIEELKHHVPDATKMIRPEPSRLEIAAMILAAVSSRRDLIEWQTKEETAWAIEQTDALIAAAKENK